jgi:hypothetical protein
VKHATVPALATIGPLLDDIRRRPGLVERKTGVFYRRGRAFLHFHEDKAGLFADLGGEEWVRFALATAAERDGFLAALDAALVAGR